jgi:hypothetical protein
MSGFLRERNACIPTRSRPRVPSLSGGHENTLRAVASSNSSRFSNDLLTDRSTRGNTRKTIVARPLEGVTAHTSEGLRSARSVTSLRLQDQD